MSKHYRCELADLEMHARVWDRVCDVLFNGHKPPERQHAPTCKEYCGSALCYIGSDEWGKPSGLYWRCAKSTAPEQITPFGPLDDVPDDETYCALYCAEERRSWEDCALVGGCPLERKGDVP